MAEWIPAALQVGSMLFKADAASESSAGSEQAAAAARKNAERVAVEKRFEAEQLRQQAGQTIAVAQRAGIEQERQARLVQSRTLAVAAAGGGGVSDPTIVNMLGRIAGEGTYRAATALYGGEEKARLMRMQAEAADYEAASAIEAGDAKAEAYDIQGRTALKSSAAGLLSNAGTLFGKYNTGAGDLFSGGAPTDAGISSMNIG